MKFDKEKILQKLKNKYRFTVHNESSLQEVWTFYLTRLNVFVFLGLLFILISVLVILLFLFTPLNAYLPTYNDSKLKREIVLNAMRADSLEEELRVRVQYFENIKSILQDKELPNYALSTDSLKKVAKVKFTRSKQDSILRKQIEEEEKNALASVENKTVSGNKLNNIQFFLPVKGIITNKFNAAEGHLGVDIVAGPNEPILAALNGTVIISTWSVATGYVIGIQHENNLITMYMHNSALLKNVGDHVEAGETIAIIGNSGELTTGPHLHFELWHNGSALNPENYITF